MVEKRKTVDEKIEYLKKQRSGEITGGYFKLLEDTYNYLKKLIDESEDNFCNPTFYEIGIAVYGGNRRTMIIKFLQELKFLGNIEIKGSGDNKKIYVLKELDFWWFNQFFVTW